MLFFLKKHHDGTDNGEGNDVIADGGEIDIPWRAVSGAESEDEILGISEGNDDADDEARECAIHDGCGLWMLQDDVQQNGGQKRDAGEQSVVRLFCILHVEPLEPAVADDSVVSHSDDHV